VSFDVCTQLWTKFFIFRSRLARVYCTETAIFSIEAEALHASPETQWEECIEKSGGHFQRDFGPTFLFCFQRKWITSFGSLLILPISKLFPQYCTIWTIGIAFYSSETFHAEIGLHAASRRIIGLW
jgi:hypothetical protein